MYSICEYSRVVESIPAQEGERAEIEVSPVDAGIGHGAVVPGVTPGGTDPQTSLAQPDPSALERSHIHGQYYAQHYGYDVGHNVRQPYGQRNNRETEAVYDDTAGHFNMPVICGWAVGTVMQRCSMQFPNVPSLLQHVEFHHIRRERIHSQFRFAPYCLYGHSHH